MRVGTPFLFVSLGECLTEKSGRINLGLEGVLVFSAMAGFGGVVPERLALDRRARRRPPAARCWRCCTALLCSLPRVNDIAIGIALMLLGTGLAFYLGKPLIQPQAPQIPSIALGGWSDSPQVQAALQINALFPLGVALAVADGLGLHEHALGPGGAHGRRLGRRGARRSATRSTACASRPPPPAASSPGSAARRCRCTTPAAGTKACPAARA